MGTSVAILCFLLISSCSAIPEQLRLSIGDDASTEMWITYVVPLADGDVDDAVVEWGTTSGGPYPSVSTNGEVITNYTGWSDQGAIHKERMAPLQPDTVYYYRVGGVQTGYSAQFSFVTAATPTATAGTGQRAVRGVVLGDQSIGPIAQYIVDTIASLMTTQQLNFVLHTGDTAIAKANQSYWDAWGRMMQPMAARTPVMVTPGNNDVDDHTETFDDSGFLSRFRMPPPGAPGGHYFYSFRYFSMWVICISTEEDYTVGSVQYNWLVSELEAANAQRNEYPWLLLYGHSPIYASSAERGNGLLQQSVERLLHIHGVDMAFFSYNHYYERTCPSVQQGLIGSYSGTGTKSDPFINPGTIHFVLGTSGQNIEGSETDPVPDWSCQRHVSYGVSDFSLYDNGTFYWHFTGQTGVTYDEMWIQKQTGCSSTCSGHGTCSPVFHKCVCDENFFGESCDIFLVQDHLVPQNSAGWKYTDQIQNFGNWTQPSFDDSQWMNGQSPFGRGPTRLYGIPFFTQLQPAISSFYFRHTFTLSTPIGNWETEVKVNVVSDDGADIYVNGILVDADSASNHNLRFWNRILTLNQSLLLEEEENVVAVFLNGGLEFDAAFDMSITVARACASPFTPPGCLSVTTGTTGTSGSTTQQGGQITTEPEQSSEGGSSVVVIVVVVILVVLVLLIVGAVVVWKFFIQKSTTTSGGESFIPQDDDKGVPLE